MDPVEGRGKEKQKRLDLMDGVGLRGGLVRLKLKHWGLTGAGRENKKEEEETVHSRGGVVGSVCVLCVLCARSSIPTERTVIPDFFTHKQLC